MTCMLLRGLHRPALSAVLAGLAAANIAIPAAAVPPPQAVAAALRSTSADAPARRGLASSGPVAPEEAALQLLDFAEVAYPAYFPSRQPTQVSSPFVFRYYPQTGIYLGIVVTSGLGYEYLGVYALGGPFGANPVWIGPLTQFITPQRTRREWLAVPAGADLGAAVAYFDATRTVSGRALVAVDPADPKRWKVVEAAGLAAEHAKVFAADVDIATTEVRRLRERWRTVFRSGRLMRLDLEPPDGQVPTWAQVSNFSTLSVCADDQQVFQNWPDPGRAWFVFAAPGEGIDNCHGTRSYRAVRLDMAAAAAPLRLSARPVTAVRDARGAIEGFILREGDGERILLSDADFRTVRVLADSTGVTDTLDYHRLVPYGVYGRGGQRYLLYLRDNTYKPRQLMGLPLTPGATPRVLAEDVHSLSAMAEDDSGLYFVTAPKRLVQVSPDLSVRTLTDVLPTIDGRLFLTPSRVVMMAGAMAPQALISVPKAGGDAEVIATLGGSGPPRANVVVIGELVLAQAHSHGGIHSVRADGSEHSGPLTGYLAASLQPVAWRLDRTPAGFDHTERLAVFGAGGAAAALTVPNYPWTSVQGEPIVRIDEGDVRREVGRFPADSLRAFTLPWEPEISDVALSGSVERVLPVHQVGSHGLLYQPYVTTHDRRAYLWLIDPTGSFTPIDVSSAVTVEP